MSDDLPTLLGPELASSIEKKGYDTLTTVQLAVLDPSLQDCDLRITSQTGSGKTLAIGFTLRAALCETTDTGLRAIIIVPTRELARQIETELRWLYEPFHFAITSVTGGTSYRDEHRALMKKPKLLVGTPGRLLDHLTRGDLDASTVTHIVLDEADRLLDMGFQEDLEAILSHIPQERRTHLVSATFSHEVGELADRVQANPRHVEGTRLGAANADIEHVLHIVDPNERIDAVINLLLMDPDAQTLVFAQTRSAVADVTQTLRDLGFSVDSLSGEMNQSARNRSLSLFRSGELHALVATDVAGRGLDIQDVTQIIHLDLPYDADTLTHRSGRTGRAGRKGVSRMIATPSTARKAMRLAQFAKIKLQEIKIPSRDELIALRGERMFAQLVAPAETSFDPALLELSNRLATHENAQQIIASLLSKSGVMGVTPRELSEPSFSRKGADPRAPKRPRRDERDFGESSGPRPRRDERDFGESSESSGPRPPRGDRFSADTSYAVFRVEAGRFDGIEVRHLIPMLCRRGNIFGTDLGNIRLENHYSLVEVAARVAEKFEHNVAGGHEPSDVDIGRFEGEIPERRASRGPREGFESRGPRSGGFAGRSGGKFERNEGKPRGDYGSRFSRDTGDRPSNYPPRGPRPGGFSGPSERPPRPHFDERREWSQKPRDDQPKWRDRDTPAFGKRVPSTISEPGGDAPAKRRVISDANPPKRPKKRPAGET